MKLKTWIIAGTCVLALAGIYIGIYKVTGFLLSPKFMPEISSEVDDFYAKRNAQDFQGIYFKADENFVKEVPFNEFAGYMGIIYRHLGNVIDKKRTAINVKAGKLSREATVDYKTSCEGGKTVDRFTFIERPGGFRLMDYRIVWSDKDLSKKPQLLPEDYNSMKKMINEMIDQELPATGN